MEFDDERGWKLEEFSNAYRAWLLAKMDGFGYEILFDVLYDTEFTWTVQEDYNRSRDGVHLRARFEYESGLPAPDGWADHPCSFLEFSAALAFTMEESIMYDPDDGNDASTWFWEMMGNCGLDEFDNHALSKLGQRGLAMVRDICDRVMLHLTDRNGRGGFFPLRNPLEDQRGVEFWYQMNEYVMENEYV